MKVIENDYWVYYINEEKNNIIKRDLVGKWMYFFKRNDDIKAICEKAVEDNIVVQCKHSTHNEGVSCFYLNKDDMNAHKRVIKFFLDNNLIQKTNSGKLYDIGFKLDSQTRERKYGDSFVPTIKLSDFLNLYTGDFL